MIFSSLEFIFQFFPIFIILYYLTPYKFKNMTLLIGSLFFYAVGEPILVVLLLISLLVNYEISKLLHQKQAKGWLVLALFLNVGLLILFKYSSFLVDNLNLILPVALPTVKLIMPLGMSFYTFQIIAYQVDVYHKKIKSHCSFLKFSTYICMFPKLVSGPIALYEDVEKELTVRKIRLEEIEEGMKLFVIGLASKVLIADKLSLLWNDIQTIGFESISTPLAWLGAFAFSLQIYFDFNGYSLMAVGLGKFLGFSLPFNFRQPYMAKSLTEFWQRWHITLGRWFREYVYIPLGGNRKGKLIMFCNLFFVWMLTGLWHGAAWNFVLWGGVSFLFIAVEKAGLKKLLDQSFIFSRLYMLILIPSTWMLFAIGNARDLGLYFKRLFPFWNGELLQYSNAEDAMKYLTIYGVFLGVGLILSTGLPSKCYEKYKHKFWVILLLVALFWISIYGVTTAANNPFLYFRF